MSKRTFTFTESQLRRLLGDTLDMFVEFRDRYERDEDSAKWDAIDETMEGLTIGTDALLSFSEEARTLRAGDTHA